MNIQTFKQLPLMGIIRGVPLERADGLVDAVISSGLKTIEVTMNTDAAPRIIERMVRRAAGRLVIGAGTVLSLDDCKQACDAGATFIVLPTLVRDVVASCVKEKIPVFPGALTPQEIDTAWRAGAAMVKVFPARFFGPQYFREIKGPFEGIELMACGGVRHDTIGEYFSCGAAAVAFGASVFRSAWLHAGDFSSIQQSIETLIAAYKAYTKHRS